MKDSVGSVLRAYLDAVILSRLQNGDTYGYAVIRNIEQESGGVCSLQEGPLYIEFRRMEKEGWIRSYWGDETVGARRRYYSLTEEGRKRLADEVRAWHETREVLNRLLEEEKEV